MAEFTFDGKRLKNRSGQKLGEMDRDLVRAYNAAKLGEIQGRNVRDINGRKILELDGAIVKDDRGKKVTTLEEIRKVIDGEGDMELVAMWQFFVRK
jgi:hypothetical protein